MSNDFPMEEYIESEEFALTSLRAIRKTFNAGLPAIVGLDEYPGKVLQVWESGKVEEIRHDEEGQLIILEVLTSDYQGINDDLKKLDQQDN